MQQRRKEEYSESLSDEIESFIINQSTAPYFLAKAKVGSHIGYLSKGQYTWIVAYYPDKTEVLWVTGDYMIYNDPLENFEITDAQLQKFPRKNIGNGSSPTDDKLGDDPRNDHVSMYRL